MPETITGIVNRRGLRKPNRFGEGCRSAVVTGSSLFGKRGHIDFHPRTGMDLFQGNVLFRKNGLIEMVRQCTAPRGMKGFPGPAFAERRMKRIE